MRRDSDCAIRHDSRRSYCFYFSKAFIGDLLQRKLDERPRLRMIANAIDTEGWRMFGPSSILVTSPTVV
jgi:hypothetical protein